MSNIPTPSVGPVVNYLALVIQQQLSGERETAVLVTVGDPSEDAPNDIIQIPTEIRRQQAPSNLVGDGGQYWLQEDYEIDVVISSAMETVDVFGDSLTLSNRAWLLEGYVETAVRNDPSLGELVQVAYPSATAGGIPVWSTGNLVGRICEITLTITCSHLS